MYEKKLKNVCVTGSGNGIGKAIAILLNEHGYNVACVDKNFNDAKKTIKQFKNKNTKSIAILADISMIDEISRAENLWG